MSDGTGGDGPARGSASPARPPAFPPTLFFYSPLPPLTTPTPPERTTSKQTPNAHNRYLAANQAQACLATDPQVNATVADLDPNTSGGNSVGLTVRVAACGPTCAAKAQALSTLLAPWAKSRQVGVAVVLGGGATAPFSPGATPKEQQAADAAAAALTGNAIYSRLGSIGGTRPPPRMVGGDGGNLGAQTVVEFAPVVVQYKTGDLSDVYGQASRVARDACAEVFGFAGGPAALSGGRAPAGVTGLVATTSRMAA